MKIGVFLAYMPGVKLGSEGLGRYIGNLIKGFTEDQNEVSIACPKWLVESLYDLFEDFHISEDSVQVITTREMPTLWRLYMKFSEKKEETRPGRKERVIRSFSDLVDYLITKILRISNIVLFSLLAVLGLLVFLALLPLALVLGVLALAAWAVLKLVKKQKHTNLSHTM